MPDRERERAWLRVLAQRARAIECDEMLGAFTCLMPLPSAALPQMRGPLQTTTLAIKDCIDVASVPTLCGGRTSPRDLPVETATCVQRLQRAGMLLAGKTNMVELAYGGWGTNYAVGTPRNPWCAELHHVPGGSSSGSGVAVAAGLADAALGTDTGGSIRIPASLNGIVGIKPGLGLVSRHGVAPLSPTLDTVGPLAPTVARAAHMLAAISGPDPLDPNASRPAFDARAALSRGVTGLRIGALEDCELTGVDPSVLRQYRAALQICAGLGALVCQVRLPVPFENYVAPTGAIISYEGWQLYAGHVAKHGTEMDSWVLQRLRAAERFGPDDYAAALARCAADRTAFSTVFDQVDVLLTPTTPLPAVPLRDVDESRYPMNRYTRAANYLDLPAVAVPSGRTSAGLPTSVQFISACGDETSAIAAAQAFQTATEPTPDLPDLTGFTSARGETR